MWTCITDFLSIMVDDELLLLSFHWKILRSGHLIGLPSNLINGIDGKLREWTSCCKASVRLSLVFVWLVTELPSPPTNSSKKLSTDRPTISWVLFLVRFCKSSKNVLDLSTTVSRVYSLDSFLWSVFKLDLGVKLFELENSLLIWTVTLDCLLSKGASM